MERTSVPGEDARGSSSGARGYLSELHTVPGWFWPVDFVLFEAINEVQRKLGLRGDLLEIGAYHGRSAILLGFFCQEHEDLVVCDVFVWSPPTSQKHARARGKAPDPSRSAFESNYRRFHQRLPTILQRPSTEIMDVGLTRSFRFIHIDGSHQYDDVRADLRNARKLLLPAGIVAVDDYSNHDFPGTEYAVWEEVIAGGLIPICLTQNKLYGSWDASEASDLSNRLSDRCLQDPLLSTTTEKIAGRQLLCVDPAATLESLAAARTSAGSGSRTRSPAKRLAGSLLPPVVTSLVRRMRRRSRWRTSARSERGSRP